MNHYPLIDWDYVLRAFRGQVSCRCDDGGLIDWDYVLRALRGQVSCRCDDGGLHNTSSSSSDDPRRWRGRCPTCGLYVEASNSPREKA